MELEADDDLLVLWDIDIVLSFCFYMLGSRIGFAFHTFATCSSSYVSGALPAAVLGLVAVT